MRKLILAVLGSLITTAVVLYVRSKKATTAVVKRPHVPEWVYRNDLEIEQGLEAFRETSSKSFLSKWKDLIR